MSFKFLLPNVATKMWERRFGILTEEQRKTWREGNCEHSEIEDWHCADCGKNMTDHLVDQAETYAELKRDQELEKQ